MANQRYASVGIETVYATPVAGTKSYEDTGDTFALQTEPVMVADTTRVGQQADLDHNYRQVIIGAEGDINVPAYENGLGLLWANLLGVATAPAAVSGTSNGRFGRNYRSSAEGDTSSMTIRKGRIVSANNWASESIEEWAYPGCVPYNFELSVSRGEPWMLRVGFDARDAVRGGSAVAQTYHSVAQQFFHWADTKIQIAAYNASGVLQAYADLDGFEGFTLNGDFNLMRDKHTLAGSANKVKPARAGKATYEGALSGGLYQNAHQTAIVDRFRSGEVCALQAVAQKRSSTASDADILRVTLARVRFTGSDPQSPPGTRGSTLEAPFKVFWSGDAADYAVDIYLQNGDSTDS